MEETDEKNQESGKEDISVFGLLKNNGVIPGSVVLSKAGHDINRIYLVLAVKEKMALLTNGTTKKVDHPKKKRVIHMKPIAVIDNREQKLSQLHFLHNKADQDRLVREWLIEEMNQFRTNKKREEP